MKHGSGIRDREFLCMHWFAACAAGSVRSGPHLSRLRHGDKATGLRESQPITSRQRTMPRVFMVITV